jgi:hypothetical protein
MSRRTRLFLLISVGILLCGVTAGVIASYYGLPAALQTRDDGPEELAYLPQDSSVVAFANVRDVMNSELRRRLTDLRPSPQPGSNDFENRTGINIERDIDSVVASFSPGEGDDDERPLVIARGNFDQTRIETIIRGQGGQVEEYRNQQVFVIGDDQPMGVSFVEPGLIAAGTVRAVRRAIDTKAAGQASVTSDAELMALVRDMDEGTAWAVGRFDRAAQARLPDAVSRQLPPISWFAVTSRINGGVEGQLRAETASDQAAQDLRQVVQGFVALARLQSGQRPEIAAMLDSLQLGGQGRTVSLTFSVPAAMLDALGTRATQNAPATP